MSPAGGLCQPLGSEEAKPCAKAVLRGLVAVPSVLGPTEEEDSNFGGEDGPGEGGS